jgi:hypothetical protein
VQPKNINDQQFKDSKLLTEEDNCREAQRLREVASSEILTITLSSTRMTLIRPT